PAPPELATVPDTTSIALPSPGHHAARPEGIGRASWTTAVAYFEPSRTLAAVTVTACCAVTGEGAVYSPEALMLPICGLILQFTVVVIRFVTVAVNWRICPA